MVKLQGYPFGYSKSSNLKKSVYFVVISPDAEYEAIPLAPYNSLPSYCPFIQYVLDVVEKDSLFYVTRIYGCSKRGKEIKRDQLVQFLMTNKYENPSTDNFVKKLETELNPFQKYVISQKAKIPASITNLNFLTGLRNTKWKRATTDILAPAFKNETYFSLLRYFSGFFLDRFNENELEFIYRILQTRPDIFCFRNLVKRICSSVSISTSNFTQNGSKTDPYYDMFDEIKVLSKSEKEVILFPTEQGKDRFYTTSNFGSDYKSPFSSEPSRVEISLGKSDDVKYNPSYPFLSIKLFEYVCEDFNLQTNVAAETLKKALKIYLKCENDRTIFGRTTYSFKNDEDYADKEALSYLLENKILCAKDDKKRLVSELQSDIESMTFSFPEDELKEAELCERLFSKTSTIKVYSADFYGRPYFQALLNLLSSAEGSTVVISSGYDTAMDLQANVSFEVIPVFKIFDKEVIEKIKKCENMLVEKINKISISDFADLLNIPKEKFNLIVIGDDKEYSIHPKSGIGELFKSFSGIFLVSDLEAFVPEDEMEQMKTDINTDEVMGCSINLIKRQILDNKTTSLPIKQFETAAEMIKEYHTIQKKLKKYLKVRKLPSKSRRIQWITSTEKSKEEILNELLAKKQGSYNKNQFLLNEFVLVHKMGICGNIKTAHQISTSGGEIPVNSKSSIKLYTGPYKLQVTSAIYTYSGLFEDQAVTGEFDDNEETEKPKSRQSKKRKNAEEMEECTFDVNTSIHAISSAEVITIREYNLKPFDYVVFYVTEETRWMDLVVASKYCRYGMIAFVKNIAHIDIAVNRKSYNRLTSLESNMVVIKSQLESDQIDTGYQLADEADEKMEEDEINEDDENGYEEIEEEIEQEEEEIMDDDEEEDS